MRGRFVAKTWPSDPARYAPAKYKKAYRYQAFIPEQISGFDEAISTSLAGLLSQAEREVRELDGVRIGALAHFEKLLIRSESIASSRVEDFVISPNQLARAELRYFDGAPLNTTSDAVLTNLLSIERAMQDATSVSKLTLQNIKDIHKELMGEEGNGGEIREVQNWIGNNYGPFDADYIPPPPGELDSLLTDLIKSMNDDQINPIVQLAITHAQFELLHPFEDGNGRTGRALIHVIMRRRRLSSNYIVPISLVFAKSRKQYIQGLNQFMSGDIEAWIEYFALSLIESARHALGYLYELESIQLSWSDLINEDASYPIHSSIWKILQLLPEIPVFNMKKLVSVTSTTPISLYKAVATLERHGILKEVTNSKRNQIWEAEEILAVLQRMID